MADLQQIARIEKNSETAIVFSLTDYRSEKYVDVREHVTSDTYTGFTKKGIRFHARLLDQWIESLQKVKDVMEGRAETPPQPAGEQPEKPGEADLSAESLQKAAEQPEKPGEAAGEQPEGG
ncbi:MAG: transcriptional coactivator p15/PC4 family protein [Planctomycetes bacterium]|nr:transcriptional coactivator p15/PC4 family protein [Planctomycetota bacterium]